MVRRLSRARFSLALIAALLIGGELRLGAATWALVAAVLAVAFWQFDRGQRLLRDLRALDAKDWAAISPRFQRMLTRRINEPGTVTLDETAARRRLKDGSVETIRWDEVQSVSVVLRPKRSRGRGAFVTLDGNGIGLVMPYSETPPDLLVALQALPGFDPVRTGLVLQQPPIGVTECWHRPTSSRSGSQTQAH